MFSHYRSRECKCSRKFLVLPLDRAFTDNFLFLDLTNTTLQLESTSKDSENSFDGDAGNK